MSPHLPHKRQSKRRPYDVARRTENITTRGNPLVIRGIGAKSAKSPPPKSSSPSLQMPPSLLYILPMRIGSNCRGVVIPCTACRSCGGSIWDSLTWLLPPYPAHSLQGEITCLSFGKDLRCSHFFHSYWSSYE